MADLKAEIRNANERFMQAYRRGDAYEVASQYAQGAMLLPPGSQPVSGVDSIRAFWQGAMDMGITDAVLETGSVEALGDAALEIGTFVLKAGDAVADRGKYLVVWRNENGAWKLYRDIWNATAQQAQSA